MLKEPKKLQALLAVLLIIAMVGWYLVLFTINTDTETWLASLTNLGLAIMGSLIPVLIGFITSYLFLQNLHSQQQEQESNKLIKKLKIELDSRFRPVNINFCSMHKDIIDSKKTLGYIRTNIQGYTEKQRLNQHLVQERFHNETEILDFFTDNANLDFAAYQRGDGEYFYEDDPGFRKRFEDASHFNNNSYQEQLDLYKGLAERLHQWIDKLNDDLKEFEQGVLIRTVFDVQKGGFFYYHMKDAPQEYLIGATINQDTMDDRTSDDAMELLQQEIESLHKNRDISQQESTYADKTA